MLKAVFSNNVGYQYKLPVAVLCFLIVVGSNLIFTQDSVAHEALAWSCTIALVGSILGLTGPRSAHSYLFFVVLGSLVLDVGVYESASFLLLLASAWSLGILVLGRLYGREDLSHISTTEAVVIGAAIWLAIWGGMLHFSINYQSLHIILCLFPCLFLSSRISSVRNELLHRVSAAQDWMRSIPFWAWVAGLAVVGWVLRWASFPSVGYDDNALHLRMWTELLTQQRYSFDVSLQIWAMAPFAVDLLHAGLSLMAGGDARSAMNLGLAIFLLLLMAVILRRWNISAWAQWLLIVLMVTTPMLGNLLLTLQTELTLAVVTLAGMLLVLESKDGWRGQHILGVIACAALCAAIKLPGAILGVTLFVALILRWRRQHAIPAVVKYQLGWSALWVLIPLAFVALHSYLLSWVVTGNPVFPLYNAIFLSPFYDPSNFSDTRWTHGFGLTSYVRAFFHTSEFFESGDYTAGWQYLIMLPLAILSLLRSGTPHGLRIILIPLLGFGFVMFAMTQYWRYLFPVMALAGVLFGSLFIQGKRVLRNLAFIFAIGCIAANLFFFPMISWLMHTPAGMSFEYGRKETLTRIYAPASLLTERVSKLAPGSRVLYTANTPYGATLHGTPLYVNWYQPFRNKAFSSLNNLDQLRDFISKEKIDFAILSLLPTTDLRDILLREYMSHFGYVESQERNFLLYRISDLPLSYRKIFELQQSETKPVENINLLMPKTAQGVAASIDGKILAVIPTRRARQARYTVEFSCPSESGYFIAQINWDTGEPYYRLVSCEARDVTFTEAIPIPIGASQGSLYVTAKDTYSIQVKNITLEVN